MSYAKFFALDTVRLARQSFYRNTVAISFSHFDADRAVAWHGHAKTAHKGFFHASVNGHPATVAVALTVMFGTANAPFKSVFSVFTVSHNVIACREALRPPRGTIRIMKHPS